MPGTKTALVELCLVLAERGSTVLLPDPGLPGLPVRRGPGGRRCRAASAGGREAPVVGGAPRRCRRRLPQLPLESLRSLRAGRRLRRGGRVRRRDRGGRRARLRLRRPRLRRAAPGKLPRHARRAGGRRRDVLAFEDLRDGGLAARVRARERRHRRAHGPVLRPRAGGDLRAAPGSGDCRVDRPAGLGRRAARPLRGAARPRAGDAAAGGRLRRDVLHLGHASARPDRRTPAR